MIFRVKISEEVVLVEIQIHHIETRDGIPVFEVIRSSDMKRTKEISLRQPAEISVVGHPSRSFLPELRWYLEEYLQAPFGAFPQLADSVTETMREWGTEVFDALFTGYARDWYQDAKRRNFKDFRIKITSDSPEVMSWPWEALHSTDDGYLALRCCIDRQLSNIGDPPQLSEALQQDSLHILYIIPRPYGENDVGYHVLADSLVDYISKNNLPVTVDVLRPPTFDQLRRVLYDRPGYYHIVHFDGHGGYGTATPTPTGNLYAAPEGQLVFEKDNGEPDAIETQRLANLLAEYNIPFMVMNACQSGMIDEQARDPFASVAAGLLKAGVRSVVAMGYSLYVSGAKEFVPAFYERLFSSGKVSEAMRAGRGKMMQQPDRDCIIGKLPLQDWVVPVLYQQMSAESAILPKIQFGEGLSEEGMALPEDARVDGDYGFIGRGSDIQKLERAIQRQPQAAILIHGQAGIGKTSLTKGFLRWLKNTGGLYERVFWFNFQEIHSAEYIINQLISELADTTAMAKPMQEKLTILVKQLSNRPYLLVWDNFESASGIEGTEIQPQLNKEDRDIIAQLLKSLRGTKTKILITSRSDEKWLQIQACYRLPLGGLTGEDLWEYCNAVVRYLGLTLDRKNKTYADIIEKLCGNPLAIRAILLRLQDLSAEQLLTELENNFEGMEGDESTRRLQAAYMVFGDSLIERFLPILQLTGLHEHYVDASYIEKMLRSSGCPVEPDTINSCYHILENAGFCTHVGQNIYCLHPALRGYLMQKTPASLAVQKGFVDIMGSLADSLAGEQLYEVGANYQVNAANFYYARDLAETWGMNTDYMALTQSLAYYAGEMRRFEESNRLFTELAEKARTAGNLAQTAAALHQLGRVAEERRDFVTAETWYKKSLEIEEKQGNERGMVNTYHQLGVIAGEQRDFGAAEAWYKKALAIEKKQGNEYGLASTYHQLGRVAEEQRDFATAEALYKKSLAIMKKQGDEHSVASIYHQLGVVVGEQRDFAAAEAWYKKSLAIKEKPGDEYGMALTYHQLGMVAQEQQDFGVAEAWYKKSMEIEEKQSNEYGMASTYHQLGIVAEKQRDFVTAEAWYKKSLEVNEKHGDKYSAAITCRQLGRIAEEQRDFTHAGDFYLNALKILYGTNDPHRLLIVICDYARLLHDAEYEERSQLRKAWSMCMDQESTEF